MAVLRQQTVTPSAARLTVSLRDIGYDFRAALADIVDNSVAAGAGRVAVEVSYAGADSRVVVADDGSGMRLSALTEAFRFGSRRSYRSGELGRYGLGLKTASLSQCRTLTVVTRPPDGQRTYVRQLDLNMIQEWDEWVIYDPGSTEAVRHARALLDSGFSTVVVWENLDRLLPADRPDGGWARRRVESAAERAGQHLGMVFHRFLEGGPVRGPLVMTVNGVAVDPWDPFAPAEPERVELPTLRFEVTSGAVVGPVELRRYVLPPRHRFSSVEQWERLSGPLKWNRQQGLYIYRADRLVQWGGWSGLRAMDEHTKLARVAVDFDTALDTVFNINVAKMRVSLPVELRQMMEQPVQETCAAAQEVYRRGSQTRGNLPVHHDGGSDGGRRAPSAAAGLALRSAALQSGDYEALQRIVRLLAEQAPELVDTLGLRGL